MAQATVSIPADRIADLVEVLEAWAGVYEIFSNLDEEYQSEDLGRSITAALSSLKKQTWLCHEFLTGLNSDVRETPEEVRDFEPRRLLIDRFCALVNAEGEDLEALERTIKKLERPLPEGGEE